MSQIYITSSVVVLSQVLPLLGLNLGNEELTAFVQTLVAIGGGIWIMIRRYSQGDITLAGAK